MALEIGKVGAQATGAEPLVRHYYWSIDQGLKQKAIFSSPVPKIV